MPDITFDFLINTLKDQLNDDPFDTDIYNALELALYISGSNCTWYERQVYIMLKNIMEEASRSDAILNALNYIPQFDVAAYKWDLSNVPAFIEAAEKIEMTEQGKEDLARLKTMKPGDTSFR